MAALQPENAGADRASGGRRGKSLVQHHRRRRTAKNRVKKVFLKSGAGGRIVKLSKPKGEPKKRAKLKKKYKYSLSKQLNSASLSPKEKANVWLDSLDRKSEEFLKAPSEDIDPKTDNSVERKASLVEDSDMASTLEASVVDQCSAETENISSDDSDGITVLEVDCPETNDTAVTQLKHSENRTAMSPPDHSKEPRDETMFEPAENRTEESIASEEPRGASDISKQEKDTMSRIKGVAKLPLTVTKRMKLRRKYRRREFLKFYLQNSHEGYHQTLKKFHRKKLAQDRKQKQENVNDSIQKAPLKIIVKERLSSSGVANSLGPSTIKIDAATPIEQKMISRVNLARNKSQRHSVVSCDLPYESSFECSPEEGCHEGTLPKLKEDQVANGSKRDVCYVFALLDRENDETLFKCSPQLKSASVLQQLAGVLDSISVDSDLMVSRKACLSEELSNEYAKGPTFTDQSTSPIRFDEKPVQDIPNMSEEESSDDSGMQSDMDRRSRMVTATIKVMISKALLGFTSELKVLTDVSIRLLGWCTGTVKADLDSGSFEDEFEGFLCHCHDKVSIIIECLSELDLRQILNVDAAELHRFWLLHDALRCMLQAYRYIQSPSASAQLSQKLLSLMMTCSKTMLPGVSLSLSRWMSLMTMVSGISSKLCEARLLSNACWCYQHFESLRKCRSCSWCDAKTFYEEVCNAAASDLTGTPSVSSSSKTAAEVLFPRFCWFLNEVEGLSKEEFMAALRKHSVVKFSCNVHSGLYPCDLHLSSVACSCFASNQDVDPHSPEPPVGTNVREAVSSNERSDAQAVLNESSDQQIVPLCVESVEEESPNSEDCPEDNLTAGGEQSTVVNSTSKVSDGSKANDVSVASSDKSTDSEETIDLNRLRSKSPDADVEVVTLNEGSSSEESSLHLEESSGNADLKRCNAAVHDHEENVDDTVVSDTEVSTDSMRKVRESSFEGQADAASQEVETLDDTDLSVTLSSDSDIALSLYKGAHSHSKRSEVDSDDSVTSIPDMEPFPDEENLMRDVSFEDDDVFESVSSEDLKGQSSIRAEVGSSSPSSDEMHSSSQGTHDGNSQRVLRSPPPLDVKRSIDADSSLEVPTSRSWFPRCNVSSSQKKVVEVQKSFSQNDIKESTSESRAVQMQRLKEDCRRRLRQGLRSNMDKIPAPMEADETPGAEQSSQNKNRSRKQRSAERREREPPKQSTSSAAWSKPVEDVKEQTRPKDAATGEARAKTSDKKVTFNDILQFKEFSDEPLGGYGRHSKQMPQNFSVSVFKQKVESLLNSMYSESQNCETSQDDEHHSVISENCGINDEDVENMSSNCVEDDLPKSKKRKLSLQSYKTRAGRTSTASEKIKQIGKLDEKFRRTFDPQYNEEKDSESKLKRTADTLEDAAEKVNVEKVNMKNTKKISPPEPKLEDAEPQFKSTLRVIKSCLKKPSRTQMERDPPSNTKHGQATENHLQPKPKLDSESNLNNASEQDAVVKKPKKTIRRLAKETPEDVMPAVNHQKSHGENPSNELTEKKKSRKGKKSESAEESGVKMLRTCNAQEIVSGATKSKKGSKRFKSESNSGTEGRDLNVSDPDWKSYLLGLKERMLDN